MLVILTVQASDVPTCNLGDELSQVKTFSLYWWGWLVWVE